MTSMITEILYSWLQEDNITASEKIRSMVWYGMVWYARHDRACYDIIWYGITWGVAVRYGVECCGTVRYGYGTVGARDVLTGSRACMLRPVGSTPAPSRSRSPANTTAPAQGGGGELEIVCREKRYNDNNMSNSINTITDRPINQRQCKTLKHLRQKHQREKQ